MDKENVIEKIKGIIAREVNNISDRDIIKDVFPETDAYAIDVQDLLNWQEEILRPLTLLDGKYMIGYRHSNREVNGQQAPPSMTEICFPVSSENLSTLIDIDVSDTTIYSIAYQSLLKSVLTTFDREKNRFQLTKWFILFIDTQFFGNFNRLLGNIVINILSYSLTGKYLIQSND